MITMKDLELVKHNGFGYFGHADRTKLTDAYVVAVANEAKVNLEDLTLFLNSHYGRYFMDRFDDYLNAGDALYTWLREHIPELKKEIA